MKKKLGYVVLAVSGLIYILYNFTVTSFLIYVVPGRTLYLWETASAELIAFIPVGLLFAGLLKLAEVKEALFEKISIKTVFIHLFVLVLFIGIHAFWQVFTNSLLLTGSTFSLNNMKMDAVAFLNLRVMVYVIAVGLIVGVKRIDEKESYELKKSELKLKLEQAKIRKLELKLNPVIIYPTLTYLKRNAMEKPDEASRLIIHLSKQMRVLIDHLSDETIPLKDDLFFFESYFQSLKIRLERPMNIVTRIRSDHLDIKVPSIVLMVPFFEELFLGDYSEFTNDVNELIYSSGINKTDRLELSIEMTSIYNLNGLKRKLLHDEHLRSIGNLLTFYAGSSIHTLLSKNTLALHLSMPFNSSQRKVYA